jgi:hypothetical protein
MKKGPERSNLDCAVLTLGDPDRNDKIVSVY